MLSRARASLPSVWVERVGPVRGVEVVAWDLDSPAPGPLDLVCLPYGLGTSGVEHLPHVEGLRTVQLLSAGYEHVVDHLPAGVALANGRTIHSAATAEQALALTLAMQHGVWSWVEGHRTRRWRKLGFQPGIADRDVLVLGYGDIGQAVVRRLLAFDPVHVTVVAQHARGGDDLVPRVHGVDALAQLLPRQDVVVVIVPLTARTERIVDADFLTRMKPGALLVNVSRGQVVDTTALQRACASGLRSTSPIPSRSRTTTPCGAPPVSSSAPTSAACRTSSGPAPPPCCAAS